MDAKKRAQMAQSRGAKATANVAPESTKNPLDDVDVQEEILNPKPASILIGGKEVVLYPLAAKHGRRFAGLHRQIILEAVAGGTEIRGAYPLTGRVAGILVERYDDRFLPYLAYATAEPDMIEDSEALARAAEFDKTITDKEMGAAFVVMSAQNIKQDQPAKNS
jgi:hypothetical protein